MLTLAQKKVFFYTVETRIDLGNSILQMLMEEVWLIGGKLFFQGWNSGLGAMP